MMKHELLKRRYLSAFTAMIDRLDVQRRWIPAVMIGDADSPMLFASFRAARSVGRSMVMLQLLVDEELKVQHRVHVAVMAGAKQRIVRDCVLWAPDAASRALLVPRISDERFQLAIGERGTVVRRPGLPVRDPTFGCALAAKRLREAAKAAEPDLAQRVLSVQGQGGMR